MALTSPFFSTLPLESHGLKWIWPEAELAHPLDDGTAVILERDIGATAAQFGSDGNAYRKLFEPLVKNWKELADGSIRIEQTIFVERESQRKIVVGAKGQTIKEIGSAARAEIGEMAGVKVHLFLFVKVRERWADDPERYREMGLDYPKR